MKLFLIVTAVIEIGAGLALLCVPSWTSELLLGTPLLEPAAFTISRVCGAGLSTLGVTAWLIRNDGKSKGFISAMMLYNLAAVIILSIAGIQLNVGIALWPAVFVHAVMTVWCVKVCSSCR